MMPEKYAMALRGKICPLHFDSTRPRMVSNWEPFGVPYALIVLDADRDQKTPRQYDRRWSAPIRLTRTKYRMAVLDNVRGVAKRSGSRYTAVCGAPRTK
jgi:hypothetical protein